MGVREEANFSTGQLLQVVVCYGVGLGLLLGHFDLTVRLWCKKLEWFEGYQVFLVPALVIGSLALVLAICWRILGCWPLLRGLLPVPLREWLPQPLRSWQPRLRQEDLEYGLTITSGALLLFLILGIGLVLATLGDLALLGTINFEQGAAGFLPLVLLLIVAQRATAASSRKWFASWQLSHCRQILTGYLWLVFFFCLAGLGVDLYLWHQNPRETPLASAAQDQLVQAGRPNIVLIVLDTLRQDRLGSYGNQRHLTPYLDRFAAEAVVFEQAAAASPWTLPSHATMFTGKNVAHHGANIAHQKLEQGQRTVAEILAANGYVTGGFVGGPYTKGKYGLGRGFMTYSDRLNFFEVAHTEDWLSILRLLAFFSLSWRDRIFGTTGERLAPAVNRDALEWLNHNSQQPFFLFVNYYDVHDPYTSGRRFYAQLGITEQPYQPYAAMLFDFSENPQQRYVSKQVPPEVSQYLSDLYDSEVLSLDEGVAALLEQLRRLKALDQTVVIITADHGEEFFDHGGVCHLQTLHRELIEVPLIIYQPRFFTPARVAARVGTVDLFSTILDLAGIRNENRFDSVSLLPLLKGEAWAERTPVVSERLVRDPKADNHLLALSGEGVKLIRALPPRGRTFDAFYDLTVDPLEEENLWDKPLPLERAAQREKLKEQAQELLPKQP